MQADIMTEFQDDQFKDKVALCLEYRLQQMQQKTNTDIENWDLAREKEKNYVNNKKGYRHMLNDIEGSEHNIRRIKGGLSIFDDEKIREHYLSKTNVPIMQNQHLSSNL